jgi:hypothetical protein
MAVRREAIAKVRAGSGTEATKARDAARHERELADLQSRHQETESAIRKLSY